jgi:hypothetical protein
MGDVSINIANVMLLTRRDHKHSGWSRKAHHYVRAGINADARSPAVFQMPAKSEPGN